MKRDRFSCVLYLLIGICVGVWIVNSDAHRSKDKILQEVAIHLMRPAYEDTEMTVEIPLREIYSDYEMDLFQRLAIAAGFTSEQFESANLGSEESTQ